MQGLSFYQLIHPADVLMFQQAVTRCKLCKVLGIDMLSYSSERNGGNGDPALQVPGRRGRSGLADNCGKGAEGKERKI